MTTTAQAAPSQLWGKDGELFDPTDPDTRIIDWSYAGYHAGEDLLPNYTPTHNVLDFGATIGDNNDDTPAFQAALDDAGAAGGGVVLVPAGEYFIANKLTLHDHVVLQGEGPGETVLILPNHALAVGGGSFFSAQGTKLGDEIGTVDEPVPRGGTSLTLSGGADTVSVGDWLRIRETGGDSLTSVLHGGLQTGIGGEPIQFLRVTAIEGDSIEFEPPLSVELRPEWSPRVFNMAPDASEIGIEHLTLEFSWSMYPGHLMELGYNAIRFKHVVDSWVRNVEIVNCDVGIELNRAPVVTVSRVRLREPSESRADENGHNGHHGFIVSFSNQDLFVDFDIQTQLVHDLGVSWHSSSIVYARGNAVALTMDHHRKNVYANLWTEIAAGAPAGANALQSGAPRRTDPTARLLHVLEHPGRCPAGLPAEQLRTAAQLRRLRHRRDPDLDARVVARGHRAEDLEPANLWEAMRERRGLGPEVETGGAMPPPGAETDGATDTGADDTGDGGETEGIDDGTGDTDGDEPGGASGNTPGGTDGGATPGTDDSDSGRLWLPARATAPRRRPAASRSARRGPNAPAVDALMR